MTDETARQTQTLAHTVAPGEVRRLMVFFGLVYFSQGLGQAVGLINQPLAYYLKSLGMTADRVAQLMAVLTIPWMIKPVYGLISDYVPLFGYRRKSYLILMNGLAMGGFLWLTVLTNPDVIVKAILLTAVGIASSDVLVDALMVENGHKTGMIRQFQGQQWMWFNIAAVTTGLIGGWLSSSYPPQTALHLAALITACAPAAVVLATMVLVREPRVELNVAQIKATTRGLMAALRSRTLWTVAGFLALWSFIPTFGMPLYYHMVDHLKFDQYFIGQLTALGAVGAVVGAFVYRRYLAVWMSTRRLVYVSIVLASAATASYLLLLSRTSAIMVYFTTSLLTMIPFLTLLSLAAAACPPQAAGFTFAAMMSIANLSGQLSSVFGVYLYERVFHQNIVPLIGISTVLTLSTMLLVPFLSIRESAHKQAY